MAIAYVALVLGGLGLIFALWALAEAMNKRPAPRVAQLRVEVADLDSGLESLRASFRKLQMRVNYHLGKERAEKEAEDEQPAETPEEWKTRTRAELHARMLNRGD